MFSSLGKLPLTVDLVPGESATSLGSRLARRNGVQRLITFCSDVGIDYFALANGNAQEVTRLAVLAGVDPAALQPGTPQLIEPGWFRLGQERIKFTAFSRTALRSCPACLAEGGHVDHAAHHGLWQLTSVKDLPGPWLLSRLHATSSEWQRYLRHHARAGAVRADRSDTRDSR